MQQRHQAPLDAFGGGVGGARHRQHQPRPISPRPGDPILYVRVGRQDCGGGPPGAGDTRCNEDTRGALFLGEERPSSAAACTPAERRWERQPPRCSPPRRPRRRCSHRTARGRETCAREQRRCWQQLGAVLERCWPGQQLGAGLEALCRPTPRPLSCPLSAHAAGTGASAGCGRPCPASLRQGAAVGPTEVGTATAAATRAGGRESAAWEVGAPAAALALRERQRRSVLLLRKHPKSLPSPPCHVHDGRFMTENS